MDTIVNIITEIITEGLFITCVLLFAASEIIAGIDKIKANSLFQAVYNLFRK